MTAGEVLAIIKSPDFDRQYESAAVDAQDKRRDATREKILVEKNLISQGYTDHAESAAHKSEANARSPQDPEKSTKFCVTFCSIVTVRFVDPGALLQSAVSTLRQQHYRS